jgi:hypothetical protein
MRAASIILLWCLGGHAFAQDISLSGGTLTVGAGTTLRIDGNLLWTLAPDGQLVNNGRIEFPPGSSLDEGAGTPVTGTGTEHSWIIAPVQNEQPGGLGFAFTLASVPAPLELVRGHQPLSLINGEESIARWYRFEQAPSAQLQQPVFHYHPSELNGQQADALDLYHADDPLGPWTPLFADEALPPFALTLWELEPRTWITAFHADATTSATAEDGAPSFRVWPSPTSGPVHVVSLSGEPITRVDLVGGDGRLAPAPAVHQGSELVLDLAHHAKGMYVLVVNGRHTFKLVLE